MTKQEIIKQIPSERLSEIIESPEEMEKFAKEIGVSSEDVSEALADLMSKQTIKFPPMNDGYQGLMFLLMCGFIAPYGSQTQISDEKRAKAKELAKAAKAATDKGESFAIKEGTELYEDNELFNAYTTEFSKLIMIDRINKETDKVSKLHR